MLYADTAVWLTDNLEARRPYVYGCIVETRPPFLDHRLVELAFSLPSSPLKVRRRRTKWVLKQVARRYLPEDVVDRPKVGFRVPMDRWFRHGFTRHGILTYSAAFVLCGQCFPAEN